MGGRGGEGRREGRDMHTAAADLHCPQPKLGTPAKRLPSVTKIFWGWHLVLPSFN